MNNTISGVCLSMFKTKSTRVKNSSYPKGYIEESQAPSIINHLVDGKWVEIEAKKENWVKDKKKIHGKIDFYLSKEWLRLRKRILKKYGRICMKCGQEEGVIQIDHIKPRSKYPELELVFDNMQVLCMPCNMKKSNKNENDYRPTEEVRHKRIRMNKQRKKKKRVNKDKQFYKTNPDYLIARSKR